MTVTRRNFLIGAASAAAGAAILDLRLAFAAEAPVAALKPFAWLTLGPGGRIALKVNSSDIGQGAQSGLAQCVAEELDVAPGDLTIEMAPVTADYFIREGEYFTGGSYSIRNDFEAFRMLGATARQMLVTAATLRWKTTPENCATAGGFVKNVTTKARLHYGVLAPAVAQLPVPTDVKLKPRAAWTVIGQPIPRHDLPDKVKGATVYGIDYQVRGMLNAALMQCPVFGGTLQSVDPAPAMAVKGVKKVVQLKDAVAVVADRFWQAKKGLATLQPKWAFGPAVNLSDATIAADLAAAFGQPGAQSFGDAAKVDAALGAAAKRIDADYALSFLSHAQLEPMNATAQVTDAGVEVWAPMQNQFGMRKDVAAALGLAEEKVVLHTLPSGGGFGRRLKTDYGVYAALVARAAGGMVKTIWTREEDFSHGHYRPAVKTKMSIGVDADGRMTALKVEGAGTNDTVNGLYNGLPYDGLAVYSVQHQVNTPVPRGAWRAVDAGMNNFFIESMVDEAAAAAGRDPLAFRKAHLTGQPRLVALLDTAAAAIGYGKPPAGRAHGVALLNAWGTKVVQIAEVSKGEDGRPRVHKVVCAIDCGLAVNPDSVRAQAMGGITMGLSAALGEAIHIAGGQTVEKNFDQYQVLRMNEAPEVEVIVVDAPGEKPGGVGEPPLPPAAPALANAWAKLTGQRVRSLPFA